jgi:hypothetical protein
VAISFRSTLHKMAPLSLRLVSMATANPGLVALVFGVVAAGVLVFYLVIIPPGSIAYP